MKLTKEDYMRLPKERLADLLVERDNEKIEPIVIPPVSIPTPVYPYTPWWKDNVMCYDQNTATSAKLNDYDFIKNAIDRKQCYNCALRKECEREHPDTYEPIGTCDKWTK